jgi:hypothetical protein
MRTKTLLLTAAFVAAGVATSMAQVYSQNVVGYVNVTVPLTATPPNPTYAILSNPLNGTNNNINTILPSVPDGTQVYLYSASGWSTETFIGGAWDPGTATLPPGTGFFISFDPAFATGPVTVTFVGEVPQGTLVNPVPGGFSLRGSIVPQAGGVTSVLGLTPPTDGDQLFRYNPTTQAYVTYTYLGSIDPENPWDPSEPDINVGEGFFLFNSGGTAYDWTRTFNVQ